MTRRLPPLNALRAFEAAARHLSFTKAAEELFVTQAAVSHQIKSLEETLGVRLFRRYNRRLELTQAGQHYLPPLRDAFDMMAVATRRLRPDTGSGQLKVSTLQSFATKWLIPRLARFHERHPDIDPMISTSQRLVELEAEEVDVAIRAGRGNYPNLHAVLLMDDLAFPVCSPRLLDGPKPLRRPADLGHHVLLHDFSVSRDGDGPNWRDWLNRAQVTGIDAEKGPSYNDTAMALQAATAGQGIALARRSLVGDDLKAGILVCPFGPEMPTRFSWYFVCAPSNVEHPKVHAFRRWLQDEIARDFGDRPEEA
ncbi:LysR family glycine cleavage system transcriptional activator [Mesorhizobium sp. J18]|uniref:transcriptional regulator GcvA n=1 Tax=Mesorhizobium sp. J18 TaxID=935263 RepID=UPI0011996C26|nr:transcriptional regulator GcvA [Mesorhizobium sp. J18]TWG97126.1 LysR family glycine cleavage system transcriptional activator [Mesorhizobium sp. J18]